MNTHRFEVPTAVKDAEVTYGFSDDSGDTSYLVTWCPGNGTKYLVMFTPLTPDLVAAAGFGFGDDSRAYLVTWIIPGEQCQSYMFTDEGYLAYGYVQEKMCFRRGSSVDASELTRIIGLALGRAVSLCTDDTGHEEYDSQL
jgi:hypothetical protein